MTINKNPDLSHVEVQNFDRVPCAGIRSHVIREENVIESEVVMGHAGFFDFENISVDKVIEVVENQIGFGFIFNSHGNNYHVITPWARSLAHNKDVKDSIDLDDGDHAEIGVKKNGWTLRITEKGDKKAPEYVGFVRDPNYPVKRCILSEPHLNFLEDVTTSETISTLVNECKTVGDRTKITHYKTRPNNHELNGDNNG